MTTEEAIALSKDILKATGFKKVQNVPVIIAVEPGNKTIHANCNHLFITELPYGCAVTSDLGQIGYELEGISDFSEIHTGQVTLSNPTGQRQIIKYLQANYTI